MNNITIGICDVSFRGRQKWRLTLITVPGFRSEGILIANEAAAPLHQLKAVVTGLLRILLYRHKKGANQRGRLSKDTVRNPYSYPNSRPPVLLHFIPISSVLS